MSKMYNQLRATAGTCAVLLLFSGAPAILHAQAQTPSSAAPDNSTHNKARQETADQQHTGASDRHTTAKIRRAIVGDKSLSTYGHNVKILTQNGTVTLKGPVHSEQEKQTIASKATEIVGQDKVINQLTVKQ